MLLDAFAKLQVEYPMKFPRLEELRDLLAAQVRNSPSSVIDVDVLESQSGIAADKIFDVLVALVALGALKLRLFWQCPDEPGTTSEADSIADFPLQTECAVCGNHHFFDKRNVEIYFLATDAR